MFGASGNGKHVKASTGKSLPNNKVTFSTATKGPAGSGAARNDRLSGSKHSK